MGRNRRHVAQSQQKDADMIRVILWNLFLFLLPFMLTALWALWVRRDSEPQVTFSPASEPESVYRIPAAGLVNGEYEVAWAAIGADGHTMADSFRFVVDLSAASSAP